ncbi:hypothetical protein BS78_03G207800 [Paspalum vaginatum]|nr:hypothetical protein BS78_03G207800 [Paspalum vaginatum]
MPVPVKVAPARRMKSSAQAKPRLLFAWSRGRRSLVRVASVPVLDHFAIRSLSSTSLSCSSARQAARSSTTPTFSRATTASSALTSSRSSASHSSSCRSYSPSVSTTAMTTTTHARPARMTGPAWGRD